MLETTNFFYSLTSEYIKRIFFYPVDMKKNIILAVLMKIPDFKTQHYFQQLLKTFLVSKCVEHLAYFQESHHCEISQETKAINLHCLWESKLVLNRHVSMLI